MTDFLDQKVQEIRDRLRELEPLLDEYDRLRAALDALDAVGTGAAAGDAEQPRPTGRRGAGDGRRGRPRTGEPTRADRLVELARERPGITIAEAAREMDVVPNGLYQVVAKLTREGELRKQGPGLFPVPREDDEPATADEPAEEHATAEEQATAEEPATAEQPENEPHGAGDGDAPADTAPPAPDEAAPADEAA